MSPAQLMFAHDLEKIVPLIETLTKAFKELEDKRNRMIHHTPLLPLLGESIPSSPARLMFAHMILWIVAIERKRSGKKRKKESTTVHLSNTSPSLVDSSGLMPIVARPLDL